MGRQPEDDRCYFSACFGCFVRQGFISQEANKAMDNAYDACVIISGGLNGNDMLSQLKRTNRAVQPRKTCIFLTK